MERERRRYQGSMRAIHWSRCARCTLRIEEGQWQALAPVPEVGTRWVHRSCAVALGVADLTDAEDAPRRGAVSAASAAVGVEAVGVEAVRLLVIGSPAWPRARAVEVRDAIAALTRGHLRVTVVHAARVESATGRLTGVDAWAELTATRLALPVEHLPAHPGQPDPYRDTRADLVAAFPLTSDPATGHPCPDPDTADAISRAHTAGLPVFTHEHPPGPHLTR